MKFIFSFPKKGWQKHLRNEHFLSFIDLTQIKSPKFERLENIIFVFENEVGTYHRRNSDCV